jgi:hypothetical protein
VKGSAAPAAPVKRNVLGDDEEDTPKPVDSVPPAAAQVVENEGPRDDDVESDSDEGYSHGPSAYYDPRRPTDCFAGCASHNIKLAT